MREFSFGLSLCLFGHLPVPLNEQVETTLVAFKSGDKRSANFWYKNRKQLIYK
jgi:hypothetical protein